MDGSTSKLVLRIAESNQKPGANPIKQFKPLAGVKLSAQIADCALIKRVYL